MNICFVNSNQAWGGGEKWHLAHARHLRDAGCRVSLLAAHGSALAERAADEPGIELQTLSLNNCSFVNPLLLARLRSFFLKRKISAVLLGLPRDLKAAGIAARLAGVGRIIYRRGMGIPVADTLLNRFLYGRVLTDLIVNSQDTRRAVLAGNPKLIPAERIHLLHNPVDIDLTGDNTRDQGAALIRSNPGTLVIGNAGRLVEQKGQVHLLEAAALLRGRGLDFVLAIAGEGPLRAVLEARAEDLGIAEQTRFLGFVADMRRFYREIDVLAFPSLWEGFANTPLEAMAAGKPVAAFAVSSLPEQVRDGENGLLAPCGDAAALAQALTLLTDPELRQRLGNNGRNWVRSTFAPEVLFPAFERIVFGQG